MHREISDLTEADLVGIVSESGLFEPTFYAAQTRLADDAPETAIVHYLHQGWRRELDPGPRFSTARYLLRNQDVREAGLNPLCHYLLWGRAEGREAEPVPRASRAQMPAPQPIVPTEADWTQLRRRHLARDVSAEATRIDVIVPVYKGEAETLRCLYSVLNAAVAQPFSLVVVDDHSPDAAIVERLAWLSERGMIEVCRTPRNLGFVAACNLGLHRHGARDVVLLNADTEVFDGWLDRLHAAAHRHPRTGTVTPFSNNAEICSYPHFVKNNWLSLEVSDPELDRLAAQANAGAELEIPTGVGFCLYIRRDCLNEIGVLDYENFREGYGEENDLCRRALSAGWRNILAADVFVRHYGGVSFGSSKDVRVREAIATVERLHPGYLTEVLGFIQRDPVRPFRQAIDLARIRNHVEAGSGPAILFVTHNRGGGTEQHVQDLIAELEANGTPCLVARPNPENGWQLCVSVPGIAHLPNPVRFDFADDPETFARLLTELRVMHIHVHHLAGFIEKSLDYLRIAARHATIGYDVTIHDYMAFCPRINLIDHTESYCGEPEAAACQTCISRHGSDFGKPVIWEWRNRFSRFLRGARRVFVPAEDVATRMRRHFPAVAFTLRPHRTPPVFLGCRETAGLRRHPHQEEGRPLVVAVLGAIGPHKGSAILLDCARYAKETGAGLSFHVIGHTDRDDQLRQCGTVTIHGSYQNETLVRSVLDVAPDFVWFPAVWPETYSYTLSAAFLSGIAPIAFDLGAIAERIRAARFGHLLPIADINDARAIVDSILALGPRAGAGKPVDDGAAYPDPLRSYYGLQPASELGAGLRRSGR